MAEDSGVLFGPEHGWLQAAVLGSLVGLVAGGGGVLAVAWLAQGNDAAGVALIAAFSAAVTTLTAIGGAVLGHNQAINAANSANKNAAAVVLAESVAHAAAPPAPGVTAP